MARGAIRRGNLTLYPNWQLGADLRRTTVYDAELRRLADLAALGAKEIAVKEFFDTGAYMQSIHAELDHNKKGLRVGLVVATDFKAHWAERGWRTGTGRTRIRKMTGEQAAGLKVIKGKKILARGARKAGLRVRAPRKRG